MIFGKTKLLQGPLHDDVTYTVNLQPRSEITTLPNTTIRITKLPVPTECSVTLLTEPEDSGAGSQREVFQISHPAVHKKINVTGSFEVIFWCTGKGYRGSYFSFLLQL